MHLVWELIDNAVDEASAGFASKVEITLHRDRSIEVADNGAASPSTRMLARRSRRSRSCSPNSTPVASSAVGSRRRVACTGSARRSSTRSPPNWWPRSIAAATPMCSGSISGWRVSSPAEAAVPAGSKAMRSRKPRISKNKTGTRVRFARFRHFDPDAVIDVDEICTRATQACFLVPGMKVTVTDKRTAGGAGGGGSLEPFEFVSRGGLADLVEHLSAGSAVNQIITCGGIDSFTEKVPVDGKMTDVERECRVDVALRWVAGYDTRISSFVNTIPTSQGAPTRRVSTRRSPGSSTMLCSRTVQAGQAEEGRQAQGGERRCPRGARRRHQGHIPRTPVPRADQAEWHALDRRHRQPIVYEQLKEWFEPNGGPRSHAAIADKLATAIPNRLRRSRSSRTSARRPSSAPPVCPKTAQLPQARPEADHPRRGRLGCRSSQAGRLRDHGDPASAGQGRECGQSKPETGARQR